MAAVTVASAAKEQITMRVPCPRCDMAEGRIEVRGGQDCVYCTGCGRWCYNAPRVETGKRQRTVTTVHVSIRPSTRAVVLSRARGRCELCGAGGIIHVSHLYSVDEGLADGFTEEQLNAPANLAAFCEECNLGQGRESVDPVLWLALVRRRLNTV